MARGLGVKPSSPFARVAIFTVCAVIGILVFVLSPGGSSEPIELYLVEAAARGRWPLLGVTIVHRVGLLQPLDQIVLVAVSSAHRGAAFAACEFIMDYLKSEAPFWKKEDTPEGARWVDARVSDDAALRRWGIESFNADPANNKEE